MNPFGPTEEVCVTAIEMLFTDYGRGVGPQKYLQGAEGSVAPQYGAHRDQLLAHNTATCPIRACWRKVVSPHTAVNGNT